MTTCTKCGSECDPWHGPADVESEVCTFRAERRRLEARLEAVEAERDEARAQVVRQTTMYEAASARADANYARWLDAGRERDEALAATADWRERMVKAELEHLMRDQDAELEHLMRDHDAKVEALQKRLALAFTRCANIAQEEAHKWELVSLRASQEDYDASENEKWARHMATVCRAIEAKIRALETTR